MILITRMKICGLTERDYSGHNAIFMARTERDKARQGFCLSSYDWKLLNETFVWCVYGR